MDGVVDIRKTEGPTSHDVVADVRRIFGQRRVGHAGTLDPMATGVLVVCLGKATRIVEYLVGTTKEYHALLTLGVTTDTQDATGGVVSRSDATSVSSDDLQRAAQRFVGQIEQVPPMVSAIKHHGSPLYKIARQGKTVERAPRLVSIHSIEVGELTPHDDATADVEIKVTCSSGTYIRTLCADIGDALGCGGMMSRLERTRVGRFTLDGAVTIDELRLAQAEDRLAELVVPMSESLADMPSIIADGAGVDRVLHGLAVEVCEPVPAGAVRVLSDRGELLAIGEADGSMTVRPRKVLMGAEDL